ncbi:MAG: hypothetical protein C0497_08095 [Gemmatimonas sp.]|nr:hypothetical protein [Gemmatimonas sp.]
MHKDLDPRDGLEPGAPRTPKEAPMADQELAPTGRISDAVHAWLDGEPVAEAALDAAPREVAFWKKVEAETNARRRMVTPASVPAQILAKLPDKG